MRLRELLSGRDTHFSVLMADWPEVKGFLDVYVECCGQIPTYVIVRLCQSPTGQASQRPDLEAWLRQNIAERGGKFFIMSEFDPNIANLRSITEKVGQLSCRLPTTTSPGFRPQQQFAELMDAERCSPEVGGFDPCYVIPSSARQPRSFDHDALVQHGCRGHFSFPALVGSPFRPLISDQVPPSHVPLPSPRSRTRRFDSDVDQLGANSDVQDTHPSPYVSQSDARVPDAHPIPWRLILGMDHGVREWSV